MKPLYIVVVAVGIGAVSISGCNPKPKTNSVTKMEDIKEYDSLNALLAGSETGFMILHQEKALGNDYHEKHDIADTNTRRLASTFKEYCERLKSSLGAPTEETDGWHEGLPAWASGNGFAVWKRERDFMTVFVSWDNPEDPSFVIAARAPLSSFAPRYEVPDPWEQQWMEKGEW